MADLKSWSDTADLRAPVQEMLNKLFNHQMENVPFESTSVCTA